MLGGISLPRGNANERVAFDGESGSRLKRYLESFRSWLEPLWELAESMRLTYPRGIKRLLKGDAALATPPTFQVMFFSTQTPGERRNCSIAPS